MNMGKVVTFGEILMRLSPPENRKLQQSEQLNFFFGGTEMNVAASLAYFGGEVLHVGAVSNDAVGDAALASLRKSGVIVSHIQKVDHPLGLYFLEVGASLRSSQITYNRLNGAFANIEPEVIDWEKALDGADYFHWTGISPGISESAYRALKEALIEANRRNVKITADPAYRSNLWKYGRDAKKTLKELVCMSNIFIGGVNEINEILETEFPRTQEGFIDASKTLMDDCSAITKVFDKVRTSVSASKQKVQGMAWTGKEYLTTPEIEITHIVDRIGTGDAYAAGLIYSLENFDDQGALNFANAACALKHTILGDANLVSVSEITEVVNGNLTGRIKR